MLGRLALATLTTGLLVVTIVPSIGCYDAPRPVCGFICGPAAACPADYTCNAGDQRCHLDGAEGLPCEFFDAGVDASDAPDAPVLVAPFVVDRSPFSNEVGVGIATLIRATFSEDVAGVSSATMIVLEGSLQITGAVTYASALRQATYTPDQLLQTNTTYTVILRPEITDFDGLPLFGAPVTWTFITGADTVAPKVQATSPVNSATAVPVNASVFALFDEPVTNVSTTTFTLAQGATPISGTVSYSAGTGMAIFDPVEQLAPSTLYTATLTSGITDLSANVLDSAPVIWTFTTDADAIGPSLLLRNPGPGTTGIGVGTTIAVTFDEDVVGVSGTTFTLLDGATPIAASVTYATATHTAILAPSLPLAANTTYTVTLTNGITDTAANPLSAAPVTWTFTTGADTLAPNVLQTSPADAATGVAVGAAIVVTFDEPVMNVTTSTFTVSDGTSVTGTLTSALGGREHTFTPAAALPANTAITVTLTTAITDTAGNPLAAQVVIAFTTAP